MFVTWTVTFPSEYSLMSISNTSCCPRSSGPGDDTEPLDTKNRGVDLGYEHEATDTETGLGDDGRVYVKGEVVADIVCS